MFSFTPDRVPLTQSFTAPTGAINYQQPVGLWNNMKSFAANNPNQLALALGMFGEAVNPTPMASAVTQTARGKIMGERLDQERKQRDIANKMLSDALAGKFTEPGVEGPTKLGFKHDGKGSSLNLDYTLGNNGNTGLEGLSGLLAQPGAGGDTMGQNLRGNPAGLRGGPGIGEYNIPGYGARRALTGAPVNPWLPRL